MAGATTRQVSGLTAIRVILGTNGHTVTGAAPAAAPGSTAGTAKTAAQYACK
jgi:hypothetical protein